ncbi:MAG: dihydroneopterin aldolase [Bacteroidales bacterium]|nr:dihydroneopterin aldolase [Bacteroidales bacterium]
MGFIDIEGMEFYAYHGHYKEEQIIGNRFLINLKIETDCSKAAESDNIKDAVNYQTAYKIIKAEMKKKSNLLENIAGRILDSLYKNMKNVKLITIKVSKMNPPMGGKINNVSVTMTK